MGINVDLEICTSYFVLTFEPFQRVMIALKFRIILYYTMCV